MTNKELLEIITIAKENHISETTLRRLITILEQNDEVNKKQTAYLKTLLKDPDIQDETLLDIWEKSYYKRNVSWETVKALQNHPLIKSFFSSEEFSKEEWKLLLEQIKKLPKDTVTDSIYIKWLRYLKSESENIKELAFFNQVFKDTLNSELLYMNWYFKYLLNTKIPLKNRENIFNIIKQNILNMLAQNIEIANVNEKAQKIVKCYEQYGYILTSSYATIITCVIDIDIPVIESEIEKNLYIELYKIFSYISMKENTEANFLHSIYYKILTNSDIPADRRLEFIKIVTSKRIILKDQIVANLWKVYEKLGFESLTIVYYAFLNNGIKKNQLCKEFFLEEEDAEVLNLAKRVLKKNRIRKDALNLQILQSLISPEEKIDFLNYLDSKYPDDTEEQEKKEMEITEKTDNLLDTYTAFLEENVGFEDLIQKLDETKNLNINMIRVRVKDNGRKI